MTSDLFHFNTLNETCRNKEAEQQHSHQMAMSKLDDINKILHNLQDELLQKTVRCHLLQMKVATMMPPSLVHTLHQTVEDCKQCQTALDKLTYGTETGSCSHDVPTSVGAGDESMVTDQ